MKHATPVTLIAALLLLHPLAYAQSLKNARPTLKSGNWTVLRSTDTMTDKTSCTGIYKSNYGVQLSTNELFVTIRGGIQSITLRFGENPARPMRLPQKMEKEVNTVIIEGSEFAEALETNRLRLQVLTLVRGVATEDLDISGMRAAVDHIRAGCPESGSTPALCSRFLRTQ